MRLKTLTGAAFAAAAVAAAATPAFAGTGTVTPNTGLTQNQAVTVTYSGFSGNVNIALCVKSISAPGFDPAADCDGDTVAFGAPAPGTTSVTKTYTVLQGPRTLAGWACGFTDDPINTPLNPASGALPEGYCFVRVVDLSLGNTTGAFEQAVTFSTATPPVPEVPYAALLPLGAVGAIGAGIFLNRRKAVAA